MRVRKAGFKDFDNIMSAYEQAKAFMRRNANPCQWGEGYPCESTVREDIATGRCYICEHEGLFAGVFVFFIGEEPTYAVIDGAWRSQSPYGTIHRLASCSSGVSAACFDFCKSRISHLRADTHRDNYIMQKIFEKSGFLRCGTIHVSDGTQRIAFEYLEDGGSA